MRHALSIVLALAIAATSLTGLQARDAQAAQGFTPPAVRVAIVRSVVSQDWVNRYGRGYGILEKQDRLFEYLDVRGWNVERISDADLESLAKLRQYDVVVCMWVFAMSPRAASTLRDYVAQGGGVATLYASPRVAPGVGGSERADHWVSILNYEGWEWGPMSEVNQTMFVDDAGAMALEAKPVWGHAIVSGAASILSARGLDSGDLTLNRDSTPGTWVEIPKMLQGNTNTSVFMTMTQKSAPTGSSSYPGTHPGAVASEYLKGRMAYFYFSPTDFLPTMNIDGSAFHTRPNGVRQGEVAGALIESAIIWAAGIQTRPGVLNRDGRTSATLNVYQDGIYASQFVSAAGNVSLSGTLYLRIYSPGGQLVYSNTRYKIGVAPGVTHRYSHQYKTGRLSDGTYRVESTYVTSYPSYARTYTETAWVRRGAGTGIRTAPDPRRTHGPYVVDPRITRIAGSDRYATSLAIANRAGGYPRPGGYVVVASGQGGADALVASSLAGAYDAPLVLTRASSLPPQVDTWLRDPAKGLRRAIIVGGTAAVSTSVERRLKQIFGSGDGVVIRLAGRDRYETSAVVARNVLQHLGDAYDGGVLVANGTALADVAAGSAVAAGKKWPILYSTRSGLPETVAGAATDLARGGGRSAWIVGGTSVVDDSVRLELERRMPGVRVTRAAGADRYETAARLSDVATAAGADWARVGIASGLRLADALCLGTLVGRRQGVMLLTNGATLSVPTANRISLRHSSVDMVFIGGGTAVVDDSVTLGVSRCLP